ncbi:MAG: bifunctional 5,10-methylenetetrahydrofolate dehydrogenase/5,10-methenyltetrahydrofolate cyclohydrolase [Bacilli bacterium]|nr:bifunctional 5,10-methylenetetrahydrofolate dehydrogenase/5,10-methenyltetrahydrofolate cyclohydrolase [Bacilli bacterium]
MELLDGKVVKKKILEELKEEVLKLKRKPGLVVIQVGDDPASKVYVGQKEKMANSVGYNFQHIKFASDIEENVIEDKIKELNNDDNVDGILVQMPLPKQLDSKKIQNLIDQYKDVDGLSDINSGMLTHNVDTLVPCTPKGIMDILEYYNIPVSGKNVVVVGRSDLVGKPLASLMLNANATVTICHSKTVNLGEFTSKADILIAAVGKAGLITKDMVKDNSVVIDVGINRVNDKLCGDVDFDNVVDKVSYITPVPGGVGQMTVAELGKNVLKAYKYREKQKQLKK